MTVEKCACVFNSAEASAPMTAATMSDIASSTPKKGGGLFPLVHGSCGLHTAERQRSATRLLRAERTKVRREKRRCSHKRPSCNRHRSAPSRPPPVGTAC